MLPAFLKQVNDTVYFNDTGEMIYYIPEKYFDNKSAVIVGEYVDLFGVFSYDVFYSNGKHLGLHNFNFPSMIRCKPTKITKESNFQLTNTSISTAYRFLHFSKGAEAICSTRVPMSIENGERFINLLIRSNLPETIKYDELHNYILENAKINGFDYSISAQLIGMIVSELCRDSKDLTKPFRLSDMKSQTDYTSMTITEIPKYTSAYVSITSENADESIASAMMNKQHKDSPLEKVMMN